MTIEKKGFVLKGVDFSMDRYFFDLQRFEAMSSGMNMTSGTESEPVTMEAANVASNLSNVSADYVVIEGNNGADVLMSMNSKYVTIRGAAANDTITAASMKYTTISGGDGDDVVNAVSTSNATLSGDAGDDLIELIESSDVTVDGGADADQIVLSASKGVSIDGGEGDDAITVDATSSNVTVNAGTGSNTINISADSKNITFSGLTDSDTIVLDGLTAMPKFATFNEGVLNVDGVKFNLEGVEVSESSAVKIKVGEAETTLGELLSKAPPYWGVTGAKKKAKTATYYAADGSILATITGLPASMETLAAEQGVTTDVDGLSVDNNNNIIISSSLLNKATITLESKDFNLDLEGDEVAFTATGLAVTGGKTAVKKATYTSKAKSDGYYVGDDGKKIKYIGANKVATAFTIGNLVAGTSTATVSTDNTLDGIEFSITGNTGTVTISDAEKFKDKKVSVGGEDVTFNITATDFASIAGAATDDHITYGGASTTINALAGNDWITDNGSKNRVSLGAGNDYLLGTYSSNTVLAGAGNDYIYLAGNYNTISGDAGNDKFEIAGGVSNTVNGGAGADFIFATNYLDSSTEVVNTHILAGAGNDTVSVAGGSDDSDIGRWDEKFTFSTIDGGAGDDHFYLDYVRETEIVSSAGNNLLNFNNSTDSKATLGTGKDTVNLGNSVNVEVSTGAGNDSINVTGGGEGITVDAGAGSDELIIKLADEMAMEGAEFYTGEGNDKVSVIGGSEEPAITSQYINTGIGNDTVWVSGIGMNNSTISTGAGDDVISVVGAAATGTGITNTYLYDFGSGNDTIYGFGANDRLVIAGADGFTASPTPGSVKETVEGGAEVEHLTWTFEVGKGSTKGTVTLVDSAATDTATIRSQISADDAKESQIKWSVSAGTATGTIFNSKGKAITVAKITGLRKATSTETNATKKKVDLAAQNAAIAAAITDNGNTIYINDSDTTIGTIPTDVSKLSVKLATGTANGYKLAIGDGFTKSENIPAELSIEGGTANFGTVTTTEGFLEDGTTITYTNEVQIPGPVVSGLNTSVTSNDLANALKGTNVVLSASALPTMTTDSDTGITISGEGYKLALGDDVAVSTSEDAKWQFDAEGVDESETSLTMAANYVSGYTTQGYLVTNEGTGILYKTEKISDTMVTVCGLKVGTKVDAIKLDEGAKTITIAKSALSSVAANRVALNVVDYEGYDSYTLKIGAGAKTAKLDEAGWKASGTTSYYQTRKIGTNGYAVSDDGKSIDWYDDEFGGNTVVTLTGLKKGAGTDKNVTLDGGVVTLGKAALGTTSVSLAVSEEYATDDNGVRVSYTLELGEGVVQSVTKDATWETVSGGVKYISELTTTAGFSLDEESTTAIYSAKGGGNTLVNITGLSGVTVTEEGAITDDVIKFTGEESDTVVLQASTIKDSVKGATVVGADYNYELSAAGALHNGSSKAVTLTGSSGKDSLYGNSGKDSLYGGAEADYLSGLAGNDYIEGGDGDDTLLGGNGNDKLYGGAGKNSILGGNGNDTLFAGDANAATTGENTLTGGVGKDLFYHLGGKTTITDYAAGADTIQVADVTGIANKVSVDGSDVIFTFEAGNSITVKNGKNKILAVTAGSETVKKKYTVSSTAEGSSPLIEEVWFDDDNELISADSLSNITETEVIGDELESSKPEKLTQENLVTYGG